MGESVRRTLKELPPSLTETFKDKKHFADQLLEAYADKEYLQYVNRLMGELVGLGVMGVKEKMIEADNLSKFDSAVSELDIANLFATNGKKVHLLTDNVWKDESPDMVVSDGSLEVYVEVKRMTDDGASNRISAGLRELLPGLGRPVRVDVTLKDELIMPVTTFEERKKKNERADEALSIMREQLRFVDLAHLPVTIQTPGADFTLLPTSQATGFPGITSIPTFSVPESQLIQKMVSDVELKAKKRDKWTGEKRNHPYMIALIDEFTWSDYDMVKMAFLGTTVEVGGVWSNPPTHPKISEAAGKGWSSYLSEEYLIPSPEAGCYLIPGKEGAFLTQDAMNNVSAVLVRTISGRHYLLPNPFCSQEINASVLCSFLDPRISRS